MHCGALWNSSAARNGVAAVYRGNASRASFSQGQNALWGMLFAQAISLLELSVEDCYRMRELMKRYSDLPMDLADAALVRLAEREKVRRIFTIDRDFRVYRPRNVGRFEILP